MQESDIIERRTKLVLFGASLAIFFTAFEVRYPVINLGIVNFTTSELAAAFFFATVVIWAATNGITSLLQRRSLDIAVLLFLVSNFLSVPVAIDKAGAFKFSLRMIYAALLYFGVSRLPQRARSHVVVAGTITTTVLIVSVIGLLENFVFPVTWGWLLSPFQEGVATFGAFYNLRVAATFPFPTTLSMYLELAMPVALAFGLWLISRQSELSKKRWLTVAVLVGTAAVMAVQLYTYTRSGLIAAPVSLMIGAAVAAVFGYGRRVWIMFAISSLLLLVILGASALLSEKMAVRLGLKEQENRYGAEYKLVEIPASMSLDAQYTARVHVKNTGRLKWSLSGSNEVTASYRWLSYPDGAEQEVKFLVTYLPREIAPGDEVDLDIEFITPSKPGRYILDLDLVQEHVAWFSSAGVPGLQVPLEFDANGSHSFVATEPPSKFDAGNPQQIQAPRSQLWRAAIQTWKDHPLLGIGPDQFRHRYTEYIPGVQPDDRIRTHDIFLEALANTGAVGLLAMLFLLGSAGWEQLRLVRNRSLKPSGRLISLALLVGLMAYIGHGLFDCFLWQTGVAFLFFSLLGLTAWLDKKARSF